VARRRLRTASPQTVPADAGRKFSDERRSMADLQPPKEQPPINDPDAICALRHILLNPKHRPENNDRIKENRSDLAV